MLHTAAVATDVIDSFSRESAPAFDTMGAAAVAEGSLPATLIKREDFDFTTLGLGGGGSGATRAASACMSGHFKVAAAADAAHSSDKRAEASLSKHLHARSTISGCLPFKSRDKMLDRIEIAPLLMRIDAYWPENPALKK